MKSWGRQSILLSIFLSFVMMTAACAPDKNNAPQASSVTHEAPISAASLDADTPAVQPKEEVREVTDESGNRLAVPVEPKRIIAAGMEDYLAALEVRPAVRYQYAYLDEYFPDVPKIHFDPGLTPEVALSYDPDLIVFGYPPDDSTYDSFSKVAPTYVYTSVWTPEADWRQMLVRFGELLGRKETAELKLKEYEAKLEETKEALKNELGEEPVGVMLYIGKSIWVMGKDKKDLLADLGFKPSELETKYGSDQISLEMMPELADADFIILETDEADTADDQKKAVDGLQSSKLWADLPAVKQGRVLVSSTEIWRGNGYISNSVALEQVMKFFQK